MMHPESLSPTCEGGTGEFVSDSALCLPPERRAGNPRGSGDVSLPPDVCARVCVCSDAGVTNTHKPYCICTWWFAAKHTHNVQTHTQHVTVSHTHTHTHIGTRRCHGVSLQLGFKLSPITCEHLLYLQTNIKPCLQYHILLWSCSVSL